MSQEHPPRFSDRSTLIFMVVLSFVCALILSVLASALADPKELAKELDRSKEMLKAARILSPEGYFQIDENGHYVPAEYTKEGNLQKTDKAVFPTQEDILEVYSKRLVPMLMDDKGNLVTFKDAKIDQDKYVTEFKKRGYYTQNYKLIYIILPNVQEKDAKGKIDPVGYIIPVNGFGLWDAIYGYLAIRPNGDTVIGTTWYDQKETPGLGANIADWDWQKQFGGKKIFQESADGSTDVKTAPIGIVVVRGKVSEVLGQSPKAKSAVDGMAGATLTGNGVTDAYQTVLEAYRPFLMKLYESKEKAEG